MPILCFIWQVELTFSAGDVIQVFGDMDEDGFFYVSGSKGEMYVIYSSKARDLQLINQFKI